MVVAFLTVRTDSNGKAMIYEGHAYHGETSGEMSTDNVLVAPPSCAGSHEQAQQLAQDALEATNCRSLMMDALGCVRTLKVGHRASLYTNMMPAYAPYIFQQIKTVIYKNMSINNYIHL